MLWQKRSSGFFHACVDVDVGRARHGVMAEPTSKPTGTEPVLVDLREPVIESNFAKSEQSILLPPMARHATIDLSLPWCPYFTCKPTGNVRESGSVLDLDLH